MQHCDGYDNQTIVRFGARAESGGNGTSKGVTIFHDELTHELSVGKGMSTAR
jgi:hypothetical protein